MMDKTLLQGLAQLETADGKKSIKGPQGQDSFNLFNVKDNSGAGYRAHDVAEGSNSAYRTYDSRESSISDLVSLLERRYPDAHQALTAGDAVGFARGLKAGGYATDPQYVDKLVGTIESVRRRAPVAENAPPTASTRAVQDSVLHGDAAIGQLTALREGGWGADIDAGLANGWSPAAIVKRIAGGDVEAAQSARDRQEATPALTRFAQGAGNAVDGAVLSAKQIMASGPEAEALRADAQGQADNLDRRALESTTAGAIGAQAPGLALNIGAGVLTGGASIPAQIAAQAGTSALVGALRPTTRDGERAANVIQDAAIGAVGGGAGAVVSKGVGAALRAVGPSEAAAAGIERATSAGLKPTARDVSPFMNGVATALRDQPAVAASDAARTAIVEGTATTGEAAARQQAIRALLGNAGQTGDSITSDVLAGAGERIYKPFNDAVRGRVVAAATGEDAAAVADGGRAALDDYRRLTSPHDLNAEMLDRTVAGQTVPGRPTEVLNRILTSTNGDELLASRTSLLGVIRSASATQADKTYAKTVLSILDAHLARQAPDIATSLATANKQYSALAPLKRLVGTTGDSGEFTTKQLARAIASNAKGSFVEGSAPQQAVLEALRAAEAGTAAQRAAGQAALAGAQGGTAIGGAIGKLANRADQGLELAALAYNPAVAAARYLGRKALAHAATSDNPALLRVLSGTTGLQRSVSDPVVRAYVARAVGGIAGGGSNSTL